jgi:hypothetical protein
MKPGSAGAKHSLLGLVALCALSSAQPAAADSLVMSAYQYPPALTFQLTGPSMNVGAGGFSAVYTPTGGAPTSFIAYCIDLVQTFSFNSSFDVTPVSALAHFGATTAGALDRLYTQRFAAVANNIESAAFQLAVWEIMNETSGSYSVSGGSFMAAATPGSNSNDLTAIGYANAWLEALSSGAFGGYRLTALTSATRQDQLMATPVSEPETYAMLLAGLGLMGFLARRRRLNLAAD